MRVDKQGALAEIKQQLPFLHRVPFIKTPLWGLTEKLQMPVSVNVCGSCLHRELLLPFISVTCSSKKTSFIPIWLLLQFWTRRSKYRDKSRLSAVTESCFPLFLASWRQISVSTDAPVTDSIRGPGLFCHFMLLNAAFWGISSWGWLLQRGHFTPAVAV